MRASHLCFAEPLLYRGTVNDSNFADINTFGMFYGAMRNSHIGMPNFPNFALKNLKGSPCDTLYKATPEPNPECSICRAIIKIKPNPVQEQVVIETATCVRADLRVYDVLGRLLLTHKTDPSGKTTMEVQGFMPGVYFIEARRPGGNCVVQMVVRK